MGLRFTALEETYGTDGLISILLVNNVMRREVAERILVDDGDMEMEKWQEVNEEIKEKMTKIVDALFGEEARKTCYDEEGTPILQKLQAHQYYEKPPVICEDEEETTTALVEFKIFEDSNIDPATLLSEMSKTGFVDNHIINAFKYYTHFSGDFRRIFSTSLVNLVDFFIACAIPDVIPKEITGKKKYHKFEKKDQTIRLGISKIYMELVKEAFDPSGQFLPKRKSEFDYLLGNCGFADFDVHQSQKEIEFIARSVGILESIKKVPKKKKQKIGHTETTRQLIDRIRISFDEMFDTQLGIIVQQPKRDLLPIEDLLTAFLLNEFDHSLRFYADQNYKANIEWHDAIEALSATSSIRIWSQFQIGSSGDRRSKLLNSKDSEHSLSMSWDSLRK